MTDNFYNIFSKPSEVNFKEKFKKLFGSYFYTLMLIIITFPIIKVIDYFIVDIFKFESVIDLISKSRKEIDVRFNFLTVAVIVPLIEEILLRLFLKPTFINITISASLLSFYIINGKILDIDFYSSTFFISILFITIIIFTLKRNYFFCAKYISSNIKIIIPISIIIFGLMHILNIKPLYYQLSILYVFFVIPQIIMGYFICNFTSVHLK